MVHRGVRLDGYRMSREAGRTGGPGQGGTADLLLVCSCGGHLLQLVAIESSWRSFSRVWVTFDKSDARSLLKQEKVVFAYGPTNRSIGNLLRNARLAWTVVRRVRPRVILTTGAGVAGYPAYANREYWNA